MSRLLRSGGVAGDTLVAVASPGKPVHYVPIRDVKRGDFVRVYSLDGKQKKYVRVSQVIAEKDTLYEVTLDYWAGLPVKFTTSDPPPFALAPLGAARKPVLRGVPVDIISQVKLNRSGYVFNLCLPPAEAEGFYVDAVVWLEPVRDNAEDD